MVIQVLVRFDGINAQLALDGRSSKYIGTVKISKYAIFSREQIIFTLVE